MRRGGRRHPRRRAVLQRASHVAVGDRAELRLAEPPASSRHLPQLGSARLHFAPDGRTVLTEVQRSVQRHSQDPVQSGLVDQKPIQSSTIR